MAIKHNANEVANWLRRIGEEAMVQGALKGMRSASLRFIGDIQKNQMTGRPGLNVRTGTLRRSWFERTRIEGKDIVTTVATATRYARVHEYGSASVPAHRVATHYRRSPGVSTQYRGVKGRRTGLRAGKLHRVRSHTRRAHTKNYPVRLHVRDSWNNVGRRLIRQRILRYWKRSFKKAV